MYKFITAIESHLEIRPWNNFYIKHKHKIWFSYLYYPLLNMYLNEVNKYVIQNENCLYKQT